MTLHLGVNEVGDSALVKAEHLFRVFLGKIRSENGGPFAPLDRTEGLHGRHRKHRRNPPGH